jgi:uncharacterized protein (DUF58 family)
MSHTVLRVLADLAIFMMVILLPCLWVLYTERFRRTPDPSQFAALLAIAAIAGVFLFLPAVSIVSVTALLALGLAAFAAKYALRGISYDRTLRPGRLFVGDEADLTLTLTNRKLLPLAWLVISDPIQLNSIRSSRKIDDFLLFSGGLEMVENNLHAIIIKVAIGPYQSLARTYRVRGLQRGVYALGPALIESGDTFGLFRRQASLGKRQEIVVYPRIYRADEIGLQFRQAMGVAFARRALFDDPTLVSGSREYRPGDPMRRIHWKATARSNDLQVRVCDPSTTAQLMIVVNLNTAQHAWQGVEPERVEAAISLAASLAMWALDKDFAVGLRSNGIVAGVENTPRVAPSASRHQAPHLLEHLARLSFSGRFGAEEILLDERKRLGSGGSMIFVTSILTPPLIQILTSAGLRDRVSVVYCGRFAAPVVRGLHVHLALPPLESDHAIS